MTSKSLFEQTPQQVYPLALRVSVLSSVLIEGVKYAAKRAHNISTSKAVKYD